MRNIVKVESDFDRTIHYIDLNDVMSVRIDMEKENQDFMRRFVFSMEKNQMQCIMVTFGSTPFDAVQAKNLKEKIEEALI